MVSLPELGESVTEGTVTRWLKQVGDEVAADESLLEVSTDKVDTEIPSPVSGTLLEIKVNEDETVEVGAELAVIGSGDAGGSGGGDAAPAPAEEAPAEEAAAEPEQPEQERLPSRRQPPRRRLRPRSRPSPSPRPSPPPSRAGRRVGGDREASGYVTPLVRKMAAQHGVDLAAVVGTGVGGRIRKQDVLDAAAQQGTDTTPTQPAAAAAAAAEPPSRPRPPLRPRLLPRPPPRRRPPLRRPPLRRAPRRRCAARPSR